MSDKILEKQLIDAVKKGLLPKVEVLLDIGADVSFWDRDFKNALMYAEDVDIAKLLIENGADVNAVNEKSHNTTALAEVKNLDVARLFIEKGADVNIKNFWKKTPLYRAVEEGNVNKANLLLDNGGDVDDVDGALVSLLMKAVCLNYNEMAYMLLEKGADVNAKDSYNRRALSFVSDVDVSKEIIARGALVNYKDVWKNTPLINAVEGNRIEIVKLFIEKGANVDAQDYQGRTALMHAVNKHYKEITEILVKSGADLNIHDDYEKSAILMADEDMRNVMFTALKEKQKKEFKPMFRVCEK